MAYKQDSINVFDNCVNAIANVLNENRIELRVNEVYNYNPEYVPLMPSIGIEFIDSTRERLTLGTIAWYRIDIVCNVIYYLREIEKLVSDEDIRKAIYKIEKVLNENVGLNGFCATMGSIIGRSQSVNIINKNRTIAGSITPVIATIRQKISTGI